MFLGLKDALTSCNLSHRAFVAICGAFARVVSADVQLLSLLNFYRRMDYCYWRTTLPAIAELERRWRYQTADLLLQESTPPQNQNCWTIHLLHYPRSPRPHSTNSYCCYLTATVVVPEDAADFVVVDSIRQAIEQERNHLPLLSMTLVGTLGPNSMRSPTSIVLVVFSVVFFALSYLLSTMDTT